ncbi:MAG: thioredoxin family protein [Betaproteobacteria bacterium]|jgi:thioredoxin-like negative regulator of GroEL|nr:thioredoxin family protein [Betaproteobacteria bacterium]
MSADSRAPLSHVASAAELDALIAAPRPLLLTFTGPKCIICRQLAPMLNVVVQEHGDALASAKVDAEALTDLSERYEIRSLPTTMIIRDGKVADRITGFATAGKLREWIAQHAFS